ncbi:hypothetical protein LINPERHAP2_LOCUS33593 [Linum perenne]
MLDQDWEDKVEHIYREVNLLADYLAGLGHDMSFCVHFIFFSHSMLPHHILYDLFGLFETCRGCIKITNTPNNI